MKEIKVYARAGQGAITTAVILGSAYFKEGRYAYAFPHFGAARMGAPMNAFIRISENPIRVRCRVYEPDYVLVIDPTLMKMENVFEGIKEGGIVLVNTTEEKIPSPDGVKIYTLPGNDIAMEVMGRPLANTVLLGAYAAVTKEIKIESLKEAIKERFKGEVGEKNALCAERGFEYMSSKL
jgi:pyruvate ferredoxin oxidoreductase gamma subunit